jgi:hypothetical protein
MLTLSVREIEVENVLLLNPFLAYPCFPITTEADSRNGVHLIGIVKGDVD